MLWMPPPSGIAYAMMVYRNRAVGKLMTPKINMLAIDLAKGSFQVCAAGQEGTMVPLSMVQERRPSRSPGF